jgi:flagellar protein FlbT
MTKTVHLTLRAGEKMFINGAVIKADRRVSFELLNEAAYLLEHQVLQPADTTTPLKQLYFFLQTIIMDRNTSGWARQMFVNSHTALLSAFTNEQVLEGLKTIRELFDRGRIFDALTETRGLFAVEEEILGMKQGQTRLLEAV